MADKRVGFIGLGNMGGPMSGRLLDAGYQLVVFDIDEQAMATAVDRGAAGAASPREVADAAEIVFTSLPTPDIVERTVTGPDGVATGVGKHRR